MVRVVRIVVMGATLLLLFLIPLDTNQVWNYNRRLESTEQLFQDTSTVRLFLVVVFGTCYYPHP